MMKKIIALLLALVMVLALAACGGQNPSETPDATNGATNDAANKEASDFFAKLAHSGLEIYQKKIGTAYSLGERVRLYDSNGFFAVGEVREYEQGMAIKPIRQFN